MVLSMTLPAWGAGATGVPAGAVLLWSLTPGLINRLVKPSSRRKFGTRTFRVGRSLGRPWKTNASTNSPAPC